MQSVINIEQISLFSIHINLVYGKTTCGWHTDDIRVHTSDIRMTYEYIRVTYGWHTSTYEWHASDIRMTYKWYTSTYDWHANDIRNIKLYNGFGAFRSLFLKLFVLKTLIYAEAKYFGSLGCSYSHTFC